MTPEEAVIEAEQNIELLADELQDSLGSGVIHKYRHFGGGTQSICDEGTLETFRECHRLTKAFLQLEEWAKTRKIDHSYIYYGPDILLQEKIAKLKKPHAPEPEWKEKLITLKRRIWDIATSMDLFNMGKQPFPKIDMGKVFTEIDRLLEGK